MSEQQTGLELDLAEMSLEDLQRLSVRHDVDPALSERASRELQFRARRAAGVMGSPGHEMLERLHKLALTEEAWSAMVETVEKHSGRTGLVSSGKGFREWATGGEMNSLTMLAS
ncbi:MAG TPA: hypothetical protein VM328_01675, partial [Fimbriimonadaceae bacterium]|nr:hypothetical protein [Fimbriimonadaceae bacterium]